VVVPLERLPASIEVTVYYLVAEALANVAKHSHATAVEIKVNQSNSSIHVVVADNGVGGAAPGAGSGLAGLADRVSALDGAFDVDSPPGRGTRLQAEIPCASS
jgi:signal transduction histidine kinase